MEFEDNHQGSMPVEVDDLPRQPTERPALEAGGPMEKIVRYRALVEYGKMTHGSWWQKTVVQPTVEGCPSCDDARWLWYVDGHWVFDSDDGLRGPTVRFCPMCGIELPNG